MRLAKKWRKERHGRREMQSRLVLEIPERNRPFGRPKHR
jgi:hypothetical protein